MDKRAIRDLVRFDCDRMLGLVAELCPC